MQVLGMGGSGLEGLSSINHVTYQLNMFYSTSRGYCQKFYEVSDVWSGMCYAANKDSLSFSITLYNISAKLVVQTKYLTREIL